MSLEIQNSRQAASQQKIGGFSVQKSRFSDLMQSLPGASASKASVTKEVRITNAVQNASEKYNLPPALVLGVIKQESGFKPQAESHCGAQGLMQLMPETAKGLGVKDSFSIEQNIEGGCKYLRQMLDRFDGNVQHALAAYNAGPGNVEKYNGVPPFAETKNYVKSVVAHAEKFQGGKLEIAEATSSTDASAEASLKNAGIEGANPQCTDGSQNAVSSLSMNRQEIREAVSMILVTTQQPEVRMPERSKNLLAEEPPPPPPSYARRV